MCIHKAGTGCILSNRSLVPRSACNIEKWVWPGDEASLTVLSGSLNTDTVTLLLMAFLVGIGIQVYTVLFFKALPPGSAPPCTCNSFLLFASNQGNL